MIAPFETPSIRMERLYAIRLLAPVEDVDRRDHLELTC